LKVFSYLTGVADYSAPQGKGGLAKNAFAPEYVQALKSMNRLCHRLLFDIKIIPGFSLSCNNYRTWKAIFYSSFKFHTGIAKPREIGDLHPCHPG
jgi:hypothetical protein